MRTEGYGGAHDWVLLFSGEVPNAGAVEHSAQTRLAEFCTTREYWKDGMRQTAVELLACSFSTAMKALLDASATSQLARPCRSGRSNAYEFPDGLHS